MLIVVLLILLILLYLSYQGKITREDVLYAQELAAEYTNEARKIYEMYLIQN